MRVVVVGAGMAGLRAAEALRRAGFDGEIAVAGGEPHMPYNRPPLSKDAIGAAFDAGQLPFRIAKSRGGRPLAARPAGRRGQPRGADRHARRRHGARLGRPRGRDRGPVAPP